MPYIIETQRTDVAAHGGTFQNALSRTAVATLDEARRVAAHEARQRIPVGIRATALLTPAHKLPESGGTVGPLPDGTVIEVRRVDRLGSLAGEGVDAFNAAQA